MDLVSSQGVWGNGQVSQAVVNLFLDELQLEAHLQALRRYMFAEEVRGPAVGVTK